MSGKSYIEMSHERKRRALCLKLRVLELEV